MNNIQQFTASFLLLQQEGHLIRSCLTIGLTNLRRANVDNKDACYSAFFNLSMGIERLLKSIIIIEHMLKNNLSVLSEKELKGYGHDIIALYKSSVSIANNLSVELPAFSAIDDINQEILKLLSDFGRSSRYYNLNALGSVNIKKDPLVNWNEIIQLVLNQDLPEKKRVKILSRGKVLGNAIDDITMTIMHGLDSQTLSTEEAVILPELYDLALKHAVLRLVNILSPIRNLISFLSHEVYALNYSVPPIPQMQEFLEWLWDDRQYVLRKRRWP